jgi:hypothetical protein
MAIGGFSFHEEWEPEKLVAGHKYVSAKESSV